MSDATVQSSAVSFDVIVVGAGPGGIAAAVTAAEAGRRVAIIDDSPFAGGQIWRNRGERAKTSAARQWLDRLTAAGDRIARFQQSRVVARPTPQTLLVETPGGPRWLAFGSLVLAVGARELFLPFPGWTLPGVVGAGGVQALVKQGLPVAGKRIVIAGTGPLLLAVAELMRASGATVPMILEQAPAGRINRFGLSLVRTPAKLLAGLTLRTKLLGTAYATDGYVTRVARGDSGLRVDYVRRGKAGTVDCDLLACGFDLIPNNELPRAIGCETTAGGFVRVDGRLRTTVPNAFAVGEITGVGGVEKAILEGRIAGHAIAGEDVAAARLGGAHASSLDFARRLAGAFALRPEVTKLAKADTIVCRCEDVPLASVETSISGRDAKLQTRCGMGPCQGRLCGPLLQRLCGAEPPQVRPPIFTTTLGTLATTPPVTEQLV